MLVGRDHERPECHLRHVYQKLGIHSRDELAQALATQTSRESEQASPSVRAAPVWPVGMTTPEPAAAKEGEL